MTPADLGVPDLKLAGLQLWVHGREFPESEDADDGNWLRVTAHCGASGASVRSLQREQSSRSRPDHCV